MIALLLLLQTQSPALAVVPAPGATVAETDAVDADAGRSTFPWTGPVTGAALLVGNVAGASAAWGILVSQCAPATCFFPPPPALVASVLGYAGIVLVSGTAGGVVGALLEDEDTKVGALSGLMGGIAANVVAVPVAVAGLGLGSQRLIDRNGFMAAGAAAAGVGIAVGGIASHVTMHP